MIRILACSAALLFSDVAAAAGPRPCLTRDELSSLIVFVAPSAIEAAAKQCASRLAEGAFLRGPHRELIDRLRAEARADRADMRTILAKLSGEKMPEGIKDETLQSLVEDVMGAEFGKEIKPSNCAAADALAFAVAPLPARNIGVLIAAMAELAEEDEGDSEKSPFSMCPSS